MGVVRGRDGWMERLAWDRHEQFILVVYHTMRVSTLLSYVLTRILFCGVALIRVFNFLGLFFPLHLSIFPPPLFFLSFFPQSIF